MKRIALVIMIIMLGATVACSSALSSGDKTNDNAHAFLLHSTQIIDRIDGDVSLAGEVYLVIKYEIENLQSQSDSRQKWTDQIILATKGKSYAPTFIESLDKQLWGTSLLPNQKESGYIAFTVPEGTGDFKLTFTFPASGNKVTYEFRPVDKRVSVNANYILTRLEQIERTRRIPLVGGILATFSSSPIQYLGIILVPEEEIPQLLEQTKGLPENAKRKVIEDYLLARGQWLLD